MKNNLLYLLFIFILTSSALFSQYDARQLPEFLDINRENYDRAMSAKRTVFYKNIPPDAFKKNKGPDRIMAEGFEIVNLSGGNSNQSETWITYNPLNPDNLVAGANDYGYLSPQSGYRMGAFSTTDGFKNWVYRPTPDNNGTLFEIPPNFSMLVFDPGITFDSRGWCYYSYGVCIIDGQDRNYDNGLFVTRSTDGGNTWESQVPVAFSNQGTLNQVFHDRYSIIADANQNSPYKDNIYLTWKRFNQNVGICFSKSTDAGQTWSTQPTLIPGGNTFQSQSPIPVIGNNGELYVVWRNPVNEFEDVMFQKSTNAGLSWLGSAKKIQSVKPIGIVNSISGRDVLTNKGNMRVSSLPYIAVDRSNGPRKGNIYIVQTGKDENGLTRLYLAKSTNGGDEWTTKIRIDDNQYGNDMFFPNISIDPVTGMISVVYYSSQNDPDNKGFDVYLAISNDGVTFRNIRITPQMIKLDTPDDIIGDNGNYYWGDYTSITSYNGKIYPCWWMPSGYNSNFWSNDVFVALLSTNPKSPVNFLTSSDYQSPNSVTLNWTDPTQNQLADPLGDFVIIIYRNDVEIARVNKGVQTYNDASAVDGQQYTYSIKTHTTEGFESSLIFSTITAGGGLKPFPPVKLSAKPLSNGVALTWENPSFHTDSTYCQDVNKIDIYVDEVKNQSYSGSIQAGQNSSMVLNIQPNQFHTIKLIAIGKRGQIETESDFSNQLVSFAGNVLTELSDSFDISPSPVIRYSKTGWDTTSVKSISAPNCLTDSPQGKYPNNSSNYVYFQPVVLSAEKTTLSFEHIALIKKNGDWGIVYVSNDFGSSWKGVLAVNSERSLGFTDDIATSTWYSERVGLSDFIGDTIMIAFELYSNNFSNSDGWFIDDLRIDDLPAGNNDFENLNSGLEFEAMPNPTADITKIKLFLPFGNNVKISLFDIMGNQIKTMYSGFINPGNFESEFDFSGLSNGIYYCKANFGKSFKIIPIIINK